MGSIAGSKGGIRNDLKRKLRALRKKSLHHKSQEELLSNNNPNPKIKEKCNDQ